MKVMKREDNDQEVEVWDGRARGEVMDGCVMPRRMRKER